MQIRPIRTLEDHAAALARIDALMDAGGGTPSAAGLEVPAVLVERCEQEAFPVDPPSALDAIRFRMEQAGIGSASWRRCRAAAPAPRRSRTGR